MDYFKKQLNKISTLWKKQNKKNKQRSTVILIALLILLSIIIVLFSGKEYVLLYSGLDSEESGEIYNQLIEMNVDVKIEGYDSIFIEKSVESYVRMQLATQGYPKSGIDYDLYMNNIDFGTSDKDKQTYLVFQLQERIQKSVETLKGIKDAIVTISIPDDSIFAFGEDDNSVTANIIVDLDIGVTLDDSQVTAIEQLMVTSISGLSKENVSIINTKAELLNNISSDDIEEPSSQYMLKKNMEKDFNEIILSMMEPIFGYGEVKVASFINLSFDKVIQESVEYQPVIDDEGIISSESESVEKTEESGTTSNIDDESTNINSTNLSSRTDKETEYKINQITQSLEVAQGTISDISISVLINREELEDEVLKKVQDLVSYSVGIDAQYVMVNAMMFEGDIALVDSINNSLNNEYPNDSKGMLAVIIPVVLGILLLGIGAGVYFLIIKKKKNKKDEEEIEEGIEVEEIQVDKNREKYWKQEIEKFVDKRPENVTQLLLQWIKQNEVTKWE